ncbi:MAG: ubiquinol-cytochrome c reductase iron-sulfur subunit [Candidatus Delongbacteria bacterium]|nr:ubiquinol-cytochrome c reductase iron-sulfur subunit [bacterium]MBL7034023.1 ubiquinol-cytochrome c reductase iron-sulfur subunit [Candidatus Delongbacteria bacterium]
MNRDSAGREVSRSRRGFLNTLLSVSAIAWLGSVFYPITRYLFPPESHEANVRSVKVGMVGNFEPDSGTIFKFGRKPGLLIRTPEGEFRAFNATCTHLDCTVQYRQDLGQIWCACHNGKYDRAGNNVSGPPPKPLEEYQVTIKDGEITVSS